MDYNLFYFIFFVSRKIGVNKVIFVPCLCPVFLNASDL